MEKSNKRSLNVKKFKELLNSCLPSKWLIFLSFSLVILQTIVSLVIPLLTMNFIDEMNFSGFDFITILILGCIFVGQLVISAIALYTMNYVGQRVVLTLRKKTWSKILQLPIPFFDENTSGNLMSRMTNDTLIIKDFITSQLIPFISGIVSIIGSIIFLLLIDWKMTGLMLLVVPLVIVIMIPFGRKMYKISRDLQDETASFQGDLGRVLTDIRLVKASLAENQEKETGFKRMENLFHYGVKEGKMLAIIQPLSMVLMLAILVIVFGYGSVRVSTGSLSAGSLVAIVFYLFQISIPISQLTSFFSHFQKALGASERVYSILLTNSEMSMSNYSNYSNSNSLSDYKKNTLEFKNVSFTYSNSKNILKSVNFQAKVGHVTAFVGPSGAGKTTIFSLLERFYIPDHGTITYKGIPIHDIPLTEWRNKIAYVSQDSPIMDGTIRSNLIYGLDSYQEESIKQAIIDANLEEFINSLPNKCETEVGERGVRLSGGQRQRIAIARAMIRNPEILLLDEATAHLDSNSERIVQEALDRLMKGRTTLVIAHRLATIRHADQIIIIEEGKVTGIGNHEKLIAEHPLYRELNHQQLSFVTAK